MTRASLLSLALLLPLVLAPTALAAPAIYAERKAAGLDVGVLTVDWAHCWSAVSGGPRLLRDGKPWLHPEVEPLPKGPAAQPRQLLGLGKDGKQLLVVTIGAPVTLAQATTAMQALGAWQAMCLEG